MNPSPGATIRIYMVGGTSCGHTRPGLSYMVASGRVRRERRGLYPDSIHVTVLRDRRWYSAPEEVSVHTTVRPLGPDTVRRRGVRVTRPERAIADSAEAGAHPDQIIAVVREALERGLTTEARLRRAVGDRSERVRHLVERGLGSPE